MLLLHIIWLISATQIHPILFSFACPCATTHQITTPRTDYNFLDGSWVETFNTYDAVAADQVPNPGFAQVHPLVESGDLTLTQTYQSLTQHGIFPPDADGGEQFPLTAHWGTVECFSLDDASELHTDVFGPYDDQGNLNDEWVEEAREILDLGLKQQDTNCPMCRAESEYWELGDEFAYPPGWWVERATEMARNKNMNTKESLQLILGVSLTGEFLLACVCCAQTSCSGLVFSYSLCVLFCLISV